MKPPTFDYAAPTRLDEAVNLLAQADGEGKVLAGGQSLMALLNMRLARPELLVDLARIPELERLEWVDGELIVGAMVRQRAVDQSAMVRERLALLNDATLHIAHPQNRNQGTVCGSLAHADPAAEYPAVALLLGASFHLKGPKGDRVVPASEFFVTYLTSALEPDEILTEVRFPALPEGSGHGFHEVARRHGDFAMVGVATSLTLDAGGRVSDGRIALFGVGATPVRATAAEEVLMADNASDTNLDEAAARVTAVLEDAVSDVHASAEYRRHVAQVLTRRALSDARDRARGKS